MKIFIWLLLRNRLVTNANLRTRNWPSGDTCVFCSAQVDEDADHLFFRCLYTQRNWNDILPTNVRAPSELQELPHLLHTMSHGPFNQSRTLAAACWNIWKERNRRIFQDIRRPSERLLMHVIANSALWDRIGRN
jgi:zinc-binding in reverse transcriptase